MVTMFWIIIFCSLIHLSTQDCINKIYKTRRGECRRISYYYDDCREYKQVHVYELRCYFSNGVFAALDHNYEIGKLNVTTSNLTEIKSVLFKNLKKLEELIMNDDNIRTIESGAFDDLPKLTTLNLAKNNLTAINRLFLLKTNVTELDLSKNKISDIDESALNLANNLILILRENKIKNVAFLNSNCEPLSSLDVSRNSIDKFVFSTACTKLTYLNVSKNNLKEFCTNLSNSISLKTLDLSFNNLSSIASDTLAYFESLERIDLSHNPLFAVNDIPTGLFQNNQNLERLILANTSVKSLKVGTFVKLESLLYLDLSSNNLNDLQKGLFHGLYSLENLDLSNNRLTRFDNFELNSLESINLNNNIWNCAILSDICQQLMKKNISLIHGDIYDTTNLFGIHCASNEEKFKIKLITNTSNVDLDSLMEYVERLLKKQQNVFEQSMIAYRDLPDAFSKDINREYTDSFRNIRKDTKKALDKIVNALDAIGDGSQNINNRMKSAIKDLNVVEEDYNDTNWKNFNIDYQNIFKNNQDKFRKLFGELVVNIKNARKAASLRSILESNNNRYDKFLLIGVYAIAFLTILLFIIFILAFYNFRNNREYESIECRPLGSA